MTTRPSGHGEGVPKHRLEALSDGVYAIALTLLVLELRLPELAHPVTSAALRAALVEVVPKGLSWLLSFWIISTFWLAQQRLFRLVARLDPRLAAIELSLLALISLFPFSSSLIGEYAGFRLAAALYSAHLVAIALVSGYRSVYLIAHPELQDPEISKSLARALRLRARILTGCAVAAFALAFVVPGLNTLAMLPTLLIRRVAPLA